MNANETDIVNPHKKNPMKKLGSWEKLCNLVGISPKPNGILLGFGSMIGASIIVFTVFLFMFPFFSPSFKNPILEDNHLKEFYYKFSQWPFSTTTTAATIDSSVPEILKNSTQDTQNVTNNSTTALIPSSSPSLEPFLKNSTEEGFSNSSSVTSVDIPIAEVLVMIEENKTPSDHNSSSEAAAYHIEKEKQENAQDEYCDANVFDGEWVKIEDRKQYYEGGSCPYVEPSPYNCYMNGRPDNHFLKWHWQWQSQPTNTRCNSLPSFLNPTDFLERLRGKKLVFAGDSLNRNMFESLVCILWSAIPDKSRVYRIPGNVEYNLRGDNSYRYEDYNFSIVFAWSPFLVNETNPKNRRDPGRNKLKPEVETLRLDLIDELASSVYRDADVVVFDSWHWWNIDKTNHGKNYFQEGKYLHPRLKMVEAYKKGLATWSKWIDNNIDSNKTQVVFRGYSTPHFHGGKWNTGGKCNREAEPIKSSEPYRERNPSQVKVLEDTLRRMKTPVLYLNISKLSYYRADGHPSLYSKNLTAQERIAAMDHQDCVHWCLPGVPDTWNELLYASLLKNRKGSFGRL
ncbi:hypothetical protein MKW92_038275 [Papaver armeniacum]|nr:hypothetical protein MKW92_038275 [Papaver armeniacum]